MKKIITRMIVIILCIVFIFYYTMNIENEAKKNAFQLEFNGIIDSIEIKKGDRGILTFKVNKKWIPSNIYTIKINQIFQVNDSVFKKRNSNIVEIYRRNNNNFYVKIYPKELDK